MRRAADAGWKGRRRVSGWGMNKTLLSVIKVVVIVYCVVAFGFGTYDYYTRHGWTGIFDGSAAYDWQDIVNTYKSLWWPTRLF